MSFQYTNLAKKYKNVPNYPFQIGYWTPHNCCETLQLFLLPTRQHSRHFVVWQLRLMLRTYVCLYVPIKQEILFIIYYFLFLISLCISLYYIFYFDSFLDVIIFSICSFFPNSFLFARKKFIRDACWCTIWFFFLHSKISLSPSLSFFLLFNYFFFWNPRLFMYSFLS